MGRRLTGLPRTRRGWCRLLTGVAIALGLGFAAVVSVSRLVDAQGEGASVIDVSGRQRMLSQRSASLAAQLGSEPRAERREALRDELRTTLEVMERSLTALRAGGPVPALDGGDLDLHLDGRLTDDLRRLYYGDAGLDRRVRGFIGAGRAVADVPDAELSPSSPALVALLAEADGALLADLDHAVALRREQVALDIGRIQLTVALASALVLLGGGIALAAWLRRRAGDATARVVAASEERFRALVQHSSELILVAEAGGTIRYASPAAEAVFGYPAGSKLGTNAFDLVHPEDQEQALVSIGRTLESTGPRARRELRIARADGSWADVEVVANNLLDDPAVSGVVFNVRDLSDRKAAERALAAEHDFVNAVVETMASLVVVTTADGHLVRMNAGAEILTGYADEEVRGRHRSMFLGAEETAVEGVGELCADDFPNSHENHWVTRFGDRRLIAWTNTCTLDAAGAISHVIATGVDVTATRRSERERRRAEQAFQVAFDHAPIGLCVATPAGRLVSANQPMCELTGRTEAELLRSSLDELVVADDVARDRELLDGLLGGDETRYAVELRYRRPDGRLAWVDQGVSLVRDDDGRPLHLVVQAEDITERRSAREELTKQALHDALTGLPNRVLLGDRLAQAVSRTQRSENKLAVLYLDLDGFKAVNDTLGHAAGDQLLRGVAERIRAVLRPADTVARLGGDEFVVLCEDLVDEHHAEVVASRVRSAIAEPMVLDAGPVTVGASIGIAYAAGPSAHDPAELLREADEAMYLAKDAAHLGRRERLGSAGVPLPPMPVDEEGRMALVDAYAVLDLPDDDEVLNDLVSLAATICETPMAVLTIVGQADVVSKASVGIETGQAPRELAFCSHTIVEPDVLLVGDTLEDERFCDNAAVTSAPGIRFYLGAPVRVDDAHALGALCVLDRVPRSLRPEQVEAIRTLSRQVLIHLELRRARAGALAGRAG